jgi:5-oxoprolinase (ATP-hydrolysing) subunit A
VKEVDQSLPVIMPASDKAMEATGVWTTKEGYVDLNYHPNGYPVIEVSKAFWEPAEVARRAVRLVRDRRLPAVDGTMIELPVPTICLHGDGPNSVDIAKAVSEAFAKEGIEVVKLAAVRR